MAVKGRIERVTRAATTPAEKDFQGSGVEGRKGAAKKEENTGWTKHDSH